MSENKGNDNERKPHPKYLYNGAAAHPVEEYIESEGDPSFILDVSWPRIVQFYLPSSNLCQEFKPRFIELARELRHRAIQTFVEFHTVSCAVHEQLCSDLGIEGVPHVMLFPSGSTEGEVVKRTGDNKLPTEFVANLIGIPILPDKKTDERQHHADSNLRAGRTKEEIDNHKIALLDASTHMEEPDLYIDAGKSLVYSIQSILDIQKKDSMLSDTQLDAFHEWIDLLHWALPSKWRLHNFVNDIRQNFDTIITNSQDFHMIIHSHDQLIPKYWSSSCSHGQVGTGYACGIWKLFHIISIGVAEQHKSVLGAGAVEEVSTQKAAEVMRDFVEEFFFTCAECKSHFLDMYDNCEHDRCHRLSLDHSSSSPKWQQLAIWMWEIHNDINIRVMNENLSRDGRIATTEDQNNALWPSHSQCQSCWKKDGTWDEGKIYMYLHNSYWPRGAQNPRLVVLDKWEHFHRGVDHHIFRIVFIFLIVMSGLSIWSKHHPKYFRRKTKRKTRNGKKPKGIWYTYYKSLSKFVKTKKSKLRANMNRTRQNRNTRVLI